MLRFTPVHDRDIIYRRWDTSVELLHLSFSPPSAAVWTGFITDECHLDKITSGPLFLRPLSCVELWLCSQQWQLSVFLDALPSVSVLADYSWKARLTVVSQPADLHVKPPPWNNPLSVPDNFGGKASSVWKNSWHHACIAVSNQTPIAIP